MSSKSVTPREPDREREPNHQPPEIRAIAFTGTIVSPRQGHSKQVVGVPMNNSPDEGNSPPDIK